MSARPVRSILWFFVPLALAFRLVYAAWRQLVPDEAFYWTLSRHLATGYLDHPPMVAYLIRVGTWICGSTEIGVRLFAVVTAFGALLLLLRMCRQLVRDERAVVFLGVIWLCSPLFAGLATVMTPDTPSIFFSVCALVVAVSIAQRLDGSTGENSPSPRPHPNPPPEDRRRGSHSTLLPWLGFGLFTGLAMLSKYTAVLPAGAVVLALLTTPAGRRELKRPGIWLAAVVALLVFSPVIYWNATHQWVSFKFQLHHGMSDADLPTESILRLHWWLVHAGSLAEYLGGQLAMWTPVLFVLGILVLVIRFATYGSLSLTHHILLWSATIPLVFFGFAAFKSGHAGEANWPAFGYFPMSLLVIEWVAQTWSAQRLKWVKIGVAISLAVAIPLHAPEMLYRLGWKKGFPRKLNEMFGWREMGRSIGMGRSGELVVATTHQDAGELSFYLPGQPDVWVYPILDETGKPVSRLTAYDFFPDRPDLSKVDRVLLVGGHAEKFSRTYGFKIVEVRRWGAPINGRFRDREIALCER